MNDMQTVNVLKGLVIDGVSQANSGHPGGAMSSMDFAYLLFSEYLSFDPDDPKWMGRDRFILSAGHESMLMYALLHHVGWLPVDELKKFRQLHSKTPGHPENYMTPGVECTTGPLGQGAAMSVGFAIAARHLGAKFGQELYKQKTWVLMGDGCMQEGVTLGAASMAGHLKLGNLVWFYDRNKIQISGKIDRSVSDDYEKIFSGFGWEVMEIDGHDHDSLRKALARGKSPSLDKPLLIIGDTTMAKGAFSMEGSHKTHGAPFPPEERAKTKEKMGLGSEDFYSPQESIDQFRKNFDKLRAEVKKWNSTLESKMSDTKFANLHKKYFENDFSDIEDISWDRSKAVATRNAFGDVLEAWADQVPNLMGGSADLEPSNMTGAFAAKVGDFDRDNHGNRNLAFGVREFPMSAICNGMALHGGLVPFDATFLSFADYSRPALRLGAIQKCRVIHEFTHDSFYLGEDGPTHQPVEHVMALRAIPDFLVMRPADAFETQVIMKSALREARPSAICLSRQKLPILDVDATTVNNAAKGAYAVKDSENPDLIIMATGGEVSLALKTAESLSGLNVKVVSMPCWELFEEQSEEYKNSVLPKNLVKRVSIEAGTTLGWQKYTGTVGLNIGLDEYGHSAPAGDLEKLYGFTPEQCSEKIKNWLSKM